MHWISKPGYRHLRAEQTSKVQLLLPLPDGTQQPVQQTGKSTSVYTYGDVKIEVPEEAQKLLNSNP